MLSHEDFEVGKVYDVKHRKARCDCVSATSSLASWQARCSIE